MSRPWVLTIGLQHVRAEFNTDFPKRAKGADGSIGDAAHQKEGSSGHNPEDSGHAEYNDHDSLNEVRALDITTALNDASGNGVTMEKVIQYIITRARAGVYMPFRYIIYNRRIWRKSNGWKTEVYTGTADPHTGHSHFSGDFGTYASTEKADNWTGSLGLATLTKKKEVEADVDVDGLIKDNNAGKTDRATTGPDTELGKLAMSQQVIDPTTGKKAMYYVAFGNLGKVVVDQAAEIKALGAKIDQLVSLLTDK